MAMTDLPPALALFAGALLMALLRGLAPGAVGRLSGNAVALIAPVVALVMSWAVVRHGAGGSVEFLGFAVQAAHPHPATAAFASIFCVVLAGGALFALNQRRDVELPGALVYGGGALGVVFAGDLISMFVFWEIMMLGSTVIVWAGGQRGSWGAGMRYFGLHAVGGVLLLIGIVIVMAQRVHSGDPDPAAFRHFGEMAGSLSTFGADTVGMWLILAGMLINAGAPPFGVWIPDAYPEGSPSGTVFLSAFTTKTAVFTLMVAFAGAHVLILLGIYMAAYGLVYAVREDDMRRLLAYAIVNQVGLMLIGIGVGTPATLDGTVAHSVVHILYKGLLLMTAGSVLWATGRRRLTEMGGLFRAMPVTALCAVVGVLGMSGLPLTSGYHTKSLISSGTTELAQKLASAGDPSTLLVVAWYAMQAASAAVLVIVGLKFLWFTFFGRDSGLRPAAVAPNMKAAMIAFAVMSLALGFAPGALYAMLPEGGEGAYAGSSVFAQAGGLVGLGLLAVLVFLVLRPVLKPTPGVLLDVDWIWRRLIPWLWRRLVAPVLNVMETAQAKLLARLSNKPVDAGPPRRGLPGTWTVSVPVLVITVVLLFYLLAYFSLSPGS